MSEPAVLRIQGEICGRCQTKMLRSRHVEDEHWLGWLVRTVVVLDECPNCGITLKCTIPMLPVKE